MDLVGIEKSGAITIEPGIEPDDRMSPDEFFDFCQANSEWRIERSADGEILVMPPAGLDSGFYEAEVIGQLRPWAKRGGRGRSFGPSAGFTLLNGAVRSPDASWVSNTRWSQLSAEQKKVFGSVCPDFVVEVKSPSDSLARLKRKMQEWIENGAELAWLILPDTKTVHIYRPGLLVETVYGVDTLKGEGPVQGFELDLTDIWT